MNERELIEQMDRNRKLMRRIDKLFFVTGILCVILNGFVTICELALIPIRLEREEMLLLIESILAPVSVFFSVLSSCKREKWTIAALSVFLIRVFIIMITRESFMASAPFIMLFALPQYLCLRKYKALSFLKGQFGYPGFNAEIYMHRPNRRTSGEEFAARMKRTKSSPESTRMDDIKPPPTHGEYDDIYADRRKPL